MADWLAFCDSECVFVVEPPLLQPDIVLCEWVTPRLRVQASPSVTAWLTVSAWPTVSASLIVTERPSVCDTASPSDLEVPRVWAKLSVCDQLS